jgi:hypothetical protein
MKLTDLSGDLGKWALGWGGGLFSAVQRATVPVFRPARSVCFWQRSWSGKPKKSLLHKELTDNIDVTC